MKLYEITGAMAGLIQKYNEAESDEQLLELEKALKDTEITFNDKALAVAHHIQNVKSDISAVENEIERLEKLKGRLKKEEEFFKGYIKRSMEMVNSEKIHSPTLKLSIVKNPPSVLIVDENAVPAQFKRTKIIVEVDKSLILQQHKMGLGVDGTIVEQKKRLRID